MAVRQPDHLCGQAGVYICQRAYGEITAAVIEITVRIDRHSICAATKPKMLSLFGGSRTKKYRQQSLKTPVRVFRGISRLKNDFSCRGTTRHQIGECLGSLIKLANFDPIQRT